MLMIWLMNFGQGTLNMAEGNEVHLNKVYAMVSMESGIIFCSKKYIMMVMTLYTYSVSLHNLCFGPIYGINSIEATEKHNNFAIQTVSWS